MSNQKKSGIATSILAFIILIAGASFGLVNMANGVRAYKNQASASQIQRMESYLELMEELSEILENPEALNTFDPDSYLDRRLQRCDLSRSQQEDIRELYEETIEDAREGALDREMAANSLTREIIYYRQIIPNPAQTQVYLRNMLIIGGTSLLLSLVIFAIMMKKARR